MDRNTTKSVGSRFLLLPGHKQLLPGKGGRGLCLWLEQACTAQQSRLSCVGLQHSGALYTHPVLLCHEVFPSQACKQSAVAPLCITYHRLMHAILRCTAQESTELFPNIHNCLFSILRFFALFFFQYLGVLVVFSPSKATLHWSPVPL